jgi:hypothetical protein
MDIAAIPRKGKGARVWLNQNHASWLEASDGLLMDGSCGGGVDFGDINQDGMLDLAVADHCDGIFVFKGNGQGLWTPASDGLPPMQCDDVALGDLNGDGHLDLCACSSTEEGVGIFYGNGQGSWEKASGLGFPATGNGHEIILMDFNGDGTPDPAATMLEKPAVWLSTGEGQWIESTEGIPAPSWGGQYWGIAAGDVNQDGHPDLALANIINGPEVYLGDGQGQWRASCEGLHAVQSAWGIALADVDRDGLTDLIVSGKTDKQQHGNVYGVFYFRGSGLGTWKLVRESGLPADGLFQSWGLAASDLDPEGALGIAACFGSASGDFPLPFTDGSENEKVLAEGRKFGPGGSLHIWIRE